MTYGGLHNGLKDGSYLTHNTGMIGPDDIKSSLFTKEAVALFSAMTTPATLDRQILMNSFIKKMKLAGIWQKLDVLYFLAAQNSQNALLNWINPNSNTATTVNSPTFTADQGYTGNGTNNYLNTNWNPFVNGINYRMNDAFVSCYVRTNPTSGAKTEIGSADGTNAILVFSRNGSDQIQNRLNNSTSTNILTSGITDSKGLTSCRRTSSSSVYNGKNGIENNLTTASSGIPSFNIYLLANNNSGTAANFSNREISFFCAGSGSGLDSYVLYTLVQEYMTSLGKQV